MFTSEDLAAMLTFRVFVEYVSSFFVCWDEIIFLFVVSLLSSLSSSCCCVCVAAKKAILQFCFLLFTLIHFFYIFILTVCERTPAYKITIINIF